MQTFIGDTDVLPARIEKPVPSRPTAFRPTVIDGARPALDVDKLTAMMVGLEGYIEASIVAFEGFDPLPSIPDEALDIRLICL